jgi:hypothetical protein
VDALGFERVYAAAGAKLREPTIEERACAGAVASRYLAVGTPRSFGIIADDATRAGVMASLDAHRTWFAPKDVRSTIDATNTRRVTIAEALAADIVCIYVPLELAANQLRRGTHVNALASGIRLDLDLQRTATIVDEAGLALMAAGRRDGRQLDEITIYVAATCSPWPSSPSP